MDGYGEKRMLDSVWVVHVSIEDAIKRIIERDKCDEQAARERLSNQIDPDEQIKYADVIIYNSGSQEELTKKVFKAYTGLDASVNKDSEV